MSFPEARDSHLREEHQVSRMEDDGHNPTLCAPPHQPQTIDPIRNIGLMAFTPDRLDLSLVADMLWDRPSHPQDPLQLAR